MATQLIPAMMERTTRMANMAESSAMEVYNTARRTE
jgi:hypothetical protein